MHPTHINDVDTTIHRVNAGNGNNHMSNNNLTQRTTPTTNAHLSTVPVSLRNGNNHENGVYKYRGEQNHSNGNGDINGGSNRITIPSLRNGNSNSNSSNSNGNSILATHTNGGNGNGNNNTNISNNTDAYRNGTRRDSTQTWTPLLANGEANGDSGSSSNVNGNGIGDSGGNNINASNGLTISSSNNNEWKDAEELNNLRNGLLHQHQTQQPAHHQQQYNNHSNNHHHHNHHHQGNNNGSLMNGKNGLGLTEKYDEQDPLTGLYKDKKLSRPSDSDESDFDSDLSGGDDLKHPSCGLFGCRPRWARRFASTHVFMVVFLLAYILQGMYMTYFVSVITTIEKLFQIKSRTTGFLLSASEMGQISTAMLLTYYAGRGHRPRWIACGMVLFSLAAFSCSLPHFIFGKELMKTSALLNARMDDTLGSAKNLHSSLGSLNVPLAALNGSSMFSQMNQDMNLCLAGLNSTSTGTECNEDRKLEQASHSKITVIVLCIFFASLLSSGIGQTAVATLGIPYIDDNVASQKSAGYIAITIGVRILGPASGFIVGSICARLYVNFSNPGFDASDPRWIGAWWLGPVMIGSLMMLSSIAMFSFPRQLRGKKLKRNKGAENEATTITTETTAAEVEEKPRLRDFPKTVRRQLSNDILMFRTASCVFHLLPIAGLYTFLPKYLETQFRLATYDANMIAAFGGILVMGVGIVISGLVILKVKPSARSVAAWIAFTALIYSAGMVILMFVGCNMKDFAGYNPGSSNTPALIEPACSAAINCTCDKENFAPICGQDGKIYISSCHAGCTTSELRDGDNKTVYSNCACIPNAPSFTEPYVAVSGYCDSNCKNFILFILIFAVCVFMHSTSEVGSMLLVMRCTHPKDKAMAMGVIQSAIGLFGNVPCPIIYGAVVDSACLIWKTVCGKHGACSLYDADTFRHYFLGITAGIMFLAFIMDLVVWSKAHRIDIAPEDKNVPNDDATNNTSNDKTAETECKRSDTSV